MGNLGSIDEEASVEVEIIKVEIIVPDDPSRNIELSFGNEG